MAEARKKTYEKIILELTPAEAKVLRTVLGTFVSGPGTGPRGKTDSIVRALDGVGVETDRQIAARSEIRGRGVLLND